MLLASFSLQAENSQEDTRIKNADAPKQWVQIGYTSNILGYKVNNFLVDNTIRVFWGGRVHVKQGASINYQRNIVNFAKILSFDCGFNASWWQSIGDKENFYTISIFPALRFNILRTKYVDGYLYYAVGGPSYISKTKMDNYDLGSKFTFMDNLGLGFFLGENHNYNIEIRIGHYSNANLFMPNQGVKVPLSLNLGYAF